MNAILFSLIGLFLALWLHKCGKRWAVAAGCVVALIPLFARAGMGLLWHVGWRLM